MSCLHEDSVNLVKWLKPTNDEVNARQQSIEMISSIIHHLWPHAVIQPFGSTKTKCYLPHGDIDLVVRNIPAEPSNAVDILGRELRELYPKPYSTLSIVKKARIPLVKITDKRTGVPIDISFDEGGKGSGGATSDFVLGKIQKFKWLRPLLFLVKYFLQMRNINEPFRGGCGSFMLSVMSTFYFQQKDEILNTGKKKKKKKKKVLCVD
eukprot:Trichotokara_eunicae@DN10474_c0_g1_i1.p1